MVHGVFLITLYEQGFIQLKISEAHMLSFLFTLIVQEEFSVGVVAHTCNHNPQETERGRSCDCSYSRVACFKRQNQMKTLKRKRIAFLQSAFALQLP